jgi:hypothetical protein
LDHAWLAHSRQNFISVACMCLFGFRVHPVRIEASKEFFFPRLRSGRSIWARHPWTSCYADTVLRFHILPCCDSENSLLENIHFSTCSNSH